MVTQQRNKIYVCINYLMGLIESQKDETTDREAYSKESINDWFEAK